MPNPASHIFRQSLISLLVEPERMKSMSQLAVLTRRWCPAQMKLEAFREVVLESSSVEELKEKVCGIRNVPDECLEFPIVIWVFISYILFPQLSEMSGIPLENLEFAKVQQSFWIRFSWVSDALLAVPQTWVSCFSYRDEELFLVTFQCWRSIRI